MHVVVFPDDGACVRVIELPWTSTSLDVRFTAMSVAVGEEGEASQSDQSVLGLTRLAEAEHQELAALTKAYRHRFGFTLIMAVRDQQNIDQLLRSGWERLNNSPTQEHAAALIEIAKIATHRFDRLVADANPIQSARTRHLDT